jgi:hypothetical protein
VPYPPLHALALAVAQDCSWVGRGFAGQPEHLTELYKQAISHKGFSLLEVLQPCVTFNKVNTYKWYQVRVYQVEDDPGYDPENELWAYQKAKEWGERIPLGVFFIKPRPILEEAYPALAAGPLALAGGAPGGGTVEGFLLEVVFNPDTWSTCHSERREESRIFQARRITACWKNLPGKFSKNRTTFCWTKITGPWN